MSRPLLSRDAGPVLLCADLSFDGRLLAPAPPAAVPPPEWWSQLLARENAVRITDGATARAFLEGAGTGELCLRIRPCVGGCAGQGTLSGPLGSDPYIASSLTWSLLRMEQTPDGDCLLQYRRKED